MEDLIDLLTELYVLYPHSHYIKIFHDKLSTFKSVLFQKHLILVFSLY